MRVYLKLALIFIFISGCGSRYLVKEDTQDLLPNEGYLGFMINSMDKLSNIQLKHVEEKNNFYIGSADVGDNLYLLKLPEGEYCFIGFDAYNLRVDFEENGFCTYIEAGDLNYFNYFRVRNPITNAFPNYNYFVSKLQKLHPNICAEYIGKLCES